MRRGVLARKLAGLLRECDPDPKQGLVDGRTSWHGLHTALEQCRAEGDDTFPEVEGCAQCSRTYNRRSSGRRARTNAENSALSCLYFWQVFSTSRGSVVL